MRLALIGATGLVGSKLLEVLEEFDFPFEELLPVASSRSLGKTIRCKGQNYPVVDIQTALQKAPHLAIFTAGGAVSKEFAPQFAAKGCRVIDNSSAFRMDQEIPLVVPEINAEMLTNHHRIIANPNCSTIQLVLALSGLHRNWQIKRIVTSTYQAVSGSGHAALQQLMGERNGTNHPNFYPHPIDLNVIPHGGEFDAEGNTSEELKLIHETRKILNAPEIQVSATVVRVPVQNGHSLSANIEFHRPFEIEAIRQTLAETPGVTVFDQPDRNEYPTPLLANEQNQVLVGRIRRDASCQNCLNLWISADNLRKGAATNALQIAQHLLNHHLLTI